MTKDTMIWQTLSMIIAGMTVNKTLPATKEEFEEKVISDALSVLAYSEDDIKNVLHTVNCTEFAQILCELYSNNITIYLYYMGNYAMKHEHLSREEADKIMDKWNDVSNPGWLAKEV